MTIKDYAGGNEMSFQPKVDRGFSPCPEQVVVVGGGRWARVIITELCGIVAPSVGICVCSRHNARAMSAWVQDCGIDRRVQVSSDWPPKKLRATAAVIIANAARDHAEVVEWAVSNVQPVLVEKPMVLSAATAHRLASLAAERGAKFAPAHVLLFARYLENFGRLVATAKSIRALTISWRDPRREDRYGEEKTYDAGLPVFADCIPHVVSIIRTLIPDSPIRCDRLDFIRGGARLKLLLKSGEVPCQVQLERNGDRRVRFIEAFTEGGAYKLDFAVEPGMILGPNQTTIGDPEWNAGSRPLATLLTAFLTWAAGGAADRRLHLAVGLQSCELIDAISTRYQAAQASWIKNKLASADEPEDDLRYAIAEILQIDGRVPESDITRRIEHLRIRPDESTGRCGSTIATPRPIGSGSFDQTGTPTNGQL